MILKNVFFSVLVLFSGFCLAAETRGGLIPESGSYWNPKHNGEGAYLDVQGNKAALTLFSYDVEGRQVFYIAAGDMRSIPGGGQVGGGPLSAARLVGGPLPDSERPAFQSPAGIRRASGRVDQGRAIACHFCRYSHLRGKHYAG